MLDFLRRDAILARFNKPKRSNEYFIRRNGETREADRNGAASAAPDRVSTEAEAAPPAKVRAQAGAPFRGDTNLQIGQPKSLLSQSWMQ